MNRTFIVAGMFAAVAAGAYVLVSGSDTTEPELLPAPATAAASALASGLAGGADSASGSSARASDASIAGLTLLGTMASDDAQFAYALIADAAGSAADYRIGDTVPGGAILTAVAQRSVDLRVGTESRTLQLTAATAPGAAFSSVPPAPMGTQPAPGAVDGESLMSGAPPRTEPLPAHKRSRSGPILSPEQRAAMELLPDGD